MDDALDRAERAMSYMETDKAVAHIQVGVTALACLGAAVDADVASRLQFLRGYLAYDDGDELVARDAYTLAHTLKPGLVWDDYLPPDSKDLFDAAAPSRLPRPTSPSR